MIEVDSLTKRVNRGAPGVDGVSIDDVEHLGVDESSISSRVRLRAGPTGRGRCGGCVSPSRASLDSPGLLGIPCVADRTVMAAAKIVLGGPGADPSCSASLNEMAGCCSGSA
jgi:hypothetical protein